MTNDKAPSARLLLVRHGEIQANLDGVWHGSTDSALTTSGQAQARCVGAYLARTRAPVAALYASPLARARDTAAEIGRAFGVETRLEPDLAEYGIGELEGESYQALLQKHRFFERIHADPSYAPSGGESRAAVTARASGALRRIAAAHRGREVVVVGHGAALAIALAELLDGEFEVWRRYHVSNCSVSELVLEPSATLVAFDEVDHLQGLAPE
jgi:probable phosphoglycerate mutase